jgi:precorrin-8X/cobalt-precorrin-8 methylmutase
MMDKDRKWIIEDYSDIGATTQEALEISRKSRKLISELIGDRSPEDRIRHNPMRAGLQALQEGAKILVDIKMVEAGIIKKGHKSSIAAFIGQGDALAKERGMTRTSAGVLASQEELHGSIVIIGNAPSALLTLCELMESRNAKPALVVGAPVGFVNASESKERLRGIDVPSISTVGTRGGTPIAVAAINEIINIFERSSLLDRTGR